MSYQKNNKKSCMAFIGLFVFFLLITTVLFNNLLLTNPSPTDLQQITPESITKANEKYKDYSSHISMPKKANYTIEEIYEKDQKIFIKLANNKIFNTSKNDSTYGISLGNTMSSLMSDFFPAETPLIIECGENIVFTGNVLQGTNNTKVQTNETTISELMPFIIIISITLCFIVFCIKMAISTSKIQKENRKSEKALKKEKNYSLKAVMQHISGLSLPQDTSCQILSCPNHYEFIFESNTFKLDKTKINNLQIVTSTETSKQAVSSVGGAIMGGAIAGPIGAAIGGRAKEKNINTSTNYLVFSYDKEGSYSEIKFKISATSYSIATKLVQEFKDTQSSTNTVTEL